MVSPPNSGAMKPICWAEFSKDYADLLNMVRSPNLAFKLLILLLLPLTQVKDHMT